MLLLLRSFPCFFDFNHSCRRSDVHSLTRFSVAQYLFSSQITISHTVSSYLSLLFFVRRDQSPSSVRQFSITRSIRMVIVVGFYREKGTKIVLFLLRRWYFQLQHILGNNERTSRVTTLKFIFLKFVEITERGLRRSRNVKILNFTYPLHVAIKQIISSLPTHSFLSQWFNDWNVEMELRFDKLVWLAVIFYK